MREKRRITRGQWIAFLCFGLLPVIAIVNGILMMVMGVRMTFHFGIPFILIPTAFLGLLAWCLLSRRKGWLRYTLAGVLLSAFIVVYLVSVFVPSYTRVNHYKGEEAQQQYNTLQQEKTLLPEISDLSTSAHPEYYKAKRALWFFVSETDYLICTYPPEEYEVQKAKLDREYIFQTEPVTINGDNCQPTVEMDGYVFRMLSVTAYEEMTGYFQGYPHQVILVGYSDESREIVYLAYEDPDLDTIPSLEEFLQDECGWKYIR